MNNLQKMDQEKNVLRWGGLAGMLGGILFILDLGRSNRGSRGSGGPCRPRGVCHEVPRHQSGPHSREWHIPGGSHLGGHPLPCLVSGSPEDEPRARSLWERPGHCGSRRIDGLNNPACRSRPALRPLSRSWGDPRGSGDTRSLVAGDLRHIQCDALRRVLCRADRSHCPRGGHARDPGLWQGLWRDEHSARGSWSRSGSSPNGRSLLFDRRGQLFRMPHLLFRPGMEGLQSVEGPAGFVSHSSAITEFYIVATSVARSLAIITSERML